MDEMPKGKKKKKRAWSGSNVIHMKWRKFILELLDFEAGDKHIYVHVN